MKTLDGKVVLVTGAASGLGRQLAMDLGRKGCRLVLSDYDESGLGETARQVPAGAVAPRTVAADVRHEQDCRSLVERTLQEFAGIDVLLLCAGVSMWARFDELQDLSVFRRLAEVNYLGAVYCIHAALPALRASQGSIVAISSLQGEISLPLHSGYAAAKHALNGFLDALDFELGDEIQILQVLPGWIRGTNLRANALSADGSPLQPRKHSRQSVSVEECSRLVIEALLLGRKELFVPRKLKALRWLQLFSPGLVRWLIGRAVRKQSDR